MPIYQIALPLPKRQLFDYEFDRANLSPGVRVWVPFGPRKLLGIVIAVVPSSPHQKKLKSIAQVIDIEPVVDKPLMKIAHWLAQYYHHPLGEVIHTLLPVALRKGESDKPAPLKMLVANADMHPDLTSLGKAKKQIQLFALLLEQSLSAGEARAQFSDAVIKALVDKQFAIWCDVAHVANALDWSLPDTLEKPKPNVQQALAITAITQALQSFRCFLLEGVTGSGKTEVYLQSIEEVLRLQRQVLILVPEIGLTPQTLARFESRFGLPVGVLHSNLTDNERLAVWQQSRLGELPIIIGTRSSIFTPMLNPGMIIVDEEHDGSYKQQDGLKYHARDLAVVLANHYQVPLVLGTATPSLESLNNALTGKYQHLQLRQRAGNALHTKQYLMDITNQPLESGVAIGMFARIENHLKQGNQVMIFVNRRGFAPALLCHQCGFVETCQRCDKPFTVHKSLHKIQCHHCGSARKLPKQCQQCSHPELLTQGVGTEQLEASLQTRFPNYSTVRIDSDNVRGKHKLANVLDAINQGKHQLLIGTQILSKGHHFPNVTLVLIVDADGALFSADFRAAEHLAQLVTQLAGRAGRADKPGEMWLQTHQPGHPLLQDLINNGYGDFARFALQERKLAMLPPHQYMVLFRAEALKAEHTFAFLSDVAQVIAEPQINKLGPIPAIMEKRQGKYRMQLLLQAKQRTPLNKAIAQHIVTIENLPSARRVRWSIDVDPQDFM